MKSLNWLISCLVTELSDQARQGSPGKLTREEIREWAIYSENLLKNGEIRPIDRDMFLHYIGYPITR